MTKFKSSAQFFVKHLVNGAKFLNATAVALLCAMVIISPLTRM